MKEKLTCGWRYIVLEVLLEVVDEVSFAGESVGQLDWLEA